MLYFKIDKHTLISFILFFTLSNKLKHTVVRCSHRQECRVDAPRETNKAWQLFRVIKCRKLFLGPLSVVVIKRLWVGSSADVLGMYHDFITSFCFTVNLSRSANLFYLLIATLHFQIKSGFDPSNSSIFPKFKMTCLTKCITLINESCTS